MLDDDLRVGNACYENGLQVAFEVGGDKSKKYGLLQAERKPFSSGISRLILINVGLRPGQTACSTRLTDAEACCVHYELTPNEDGFFRRTQAAVLRNPLTSTTTFEVAFEIGDLIGDGEHAREQWREGLRFGFSMLLNDGDEAAAQRGWAGYYPHAIVLGNWPQKEPQELGTVSRIANALATCCLDPLAHSDPALSTPVAPEHVRLGGLCLTLAVTPTSPSPTPALTVAGW